MGVGEDGGGMFSKGKPTFFLRTHFLYFITFVCHIKYVVFVV